MATLYVIGSVIIIIIIGFIALLTIIGLSNTKFIKRLKKKD